MKKILTPLSDPRTPESSSRILDPSPPSPSSPSPLPLPPWIAPTPRLSPKPPSLIYWALPCCRYIRSFWVLFSYELYSAQNVEFMQHKTTVLWLWRHAMGMFVAFLWYVTFPSLASFLNRGYRQYLYSKPCSQSSYYKAFTKRRNSGLTFSSIVTPFHVECVPFFAGLRSERWVFRLLYSNVIFHSTACSPVIKETLCMQMYNSHIPYPLFGSSYFVRMEWDIIP